MLTHSSKTDSNKTQAVSVPQEKAKSSQGIIGAPGFLMSPQSILQLQGTIGNRAVIQLLKSQFQLQPVGLPVQRMEHEEKEMQMKQDKIQKKNGLVAGPRKNNTGLPDDLKAGVESLSGLPMDDVKVHYNSTRPTKIGALAYTLGKDIHVAPGQQKHLPHEAWHVVQQSQGRVKPTFQMKGLAVNDDVDLEREAEEMGRKGEGVDENSKSPQGKVIVGSESQDKTIQMVLEPTKSELLSPQVLKQTVDLLVSKGVKKATKGELKKYTDLKKASVQQIAQISKALSEYWEGQKSKNPTKAEKLKEENERLGKISKQEKEKVGRRPKQKRDQQLNLNHAGLYKSVKFSELSEEVRTVILQGHKVATWEKHQTDPETGKEGPGIAEYKPFGTNSKIRLVSSSDGKWYYCPDHNIYGLYTYHKVTDIHQ